MKRRVLIVEDDVSLARVVEATLAVEGFDVRWAADGDAALEAEHEFAPDLILLDISLPHRSGFELCARWSQGHRIPIIILTARSDRADKLQGLTMGAEDYITKPFDVEELLARIRIVLRRTRPTLRRIELGPVVVDFAGLRAWSGPRPIDLTSREFELLRYLAEREGRIVHRDELLREVWGYANPPHTRSVDAAIVRLRRKIEADPKHPEFVHTVHGDGYRLTVPAADALAASDQARATEP